MLLWGVGAGVSRVQQETITFYLDLEPSQKADFEVVGRSAAAFAETVKEIAYILEPGLQVRLEFESGVEAHSLNLNAILKDPQARRAALIAIVVTVGGWFANDLRTYGIAKFLDAYLMPAQRQE